MFALIIAIFLSVILITAFVFMDQSVTDLISATPFSNLNGSFTASSADPEAPAASIELPDPGSCSSGGSCG